MGPHDDKIFSTAAHSYASEGAGVGGGNQATVRYPPPKGSIVLDMGFGDAKCVRGALELGCTVFGTDLAERSWMEALENGLLDPGSGFLPLWMDMCHDKLPIPDNVVDYAYCLETPEHLSNPYFAFAEAKRVLKHRGKFIIVFPMPESNLGYSGGKHAHVYPGFLQRKSFEQFMMQLYFKQLEREECGDSVWYLFENIKEYGEGQVICDTFKVISGNWEDDPDVENNFDKLYGWLKDA